MIGPIESYQNYQELDEKESLLKLQMTKDISVEKMYELCEKAISYCKEMYKLAKDKRAHKLFILNGPIHSGFTHGLQGYLNAKKWMNDGKMTFFKEECRKFALVQQIIAKIAIGKTLHFYAAREANQNFEKFVETIDIRSIGFVICRQKKGQKKRN